MQADKIKESEPWFWPKYYEEKGRYWFMVKGHEKSHIAISFHCGKLELASSHPPCTIFCVLEVSQVGPIYEAIARVSGSFLLRSSFSRAIHDILDLANELL